MYKSLLIKTIQKVQILCHLVKVKREYCNCSKFLITTKLRTKNHRICIRKNLGTSRNVDIQNLIALRLNPS